MSDSQMVTFAKSPHGLKRRKPLSKQDRIIKNYRVAGEEQPASKGTQSKDELIPKILIL